MNKDGPSPPDKSGTDTSGGRRLGYKTIVLGIAIIIAGGAAFLGVLSLLGRAGDPRSIERIGLRDESIFVDPEALGKSHVLQNVIHSVGHYDGVLIYDVKYSLDGKANRITPARDRDKRHQFMAFFGCSFTFGHGVNDDETLPFYAGELCAEFMPYNYGQRGNGPQQILQRIQSAALPEEIQEQRGVGVYVYMPHHIERLIGSMPTFNLWVSNFPYYYLDKNGKLVQDGTFRSGRPWRSALYDALWSWPVLSWFEIMLPIKRTNSDMDLLVGVIREAKNAFLTQFPDSQFVVLMYYYPKHSLSKWNLHPYMVERLHAEGITVIDGSAWLTEEHFSEYMLPDFHPRPAMHRRVAEELVRGLGLIPDLEHSSTAPPQPSDASSAPQ